MNSTVNGSRLSRADAFSLFAAVAAMVAVLYLHLLTALLAGLLVYELVHLLAARLRVASLGREPAKLVAVALLTIIVVGLLTAAVLGIGNFLRNGTDSVPALLERLAEAIDNSRSRLPAWIVQSLPSDAEALRGDLVVWLREHSSVVQGFGRSFGRGLAHILIGMVVGAMLALREATPGHTRGPLARAIVERSSRLAESFRRVVFAQTWIASINALFTWIYVGVALPAFGVDLPQVKTLVLVTWIAGLLPILGNLISNTVIVAVSIGHSLELAFISLAYLIVIHKLEYFLNARIIGSQIRSRAWELLIAMMVMEAAFGLSGIIAAPIFYAYLKEELTRLRLT
ncbi:AI-2E family transporter [Nevskia sp.]|uniref:AI-2E family transporter n=1 Tax=Nevskia sp. TaxID=1929292 RepID=UPI0025DAF517|nr:AI-2E family transporter [Nevskia sp.]